PPVFLSNRRPHMAKKPTAGKKAQKKDTATKPKPADPPASLSPQQVHELLALPSPYDPPRPPAPWPGYVTLWDPVRRDS
ncbi:MAG: hypothetical protein LC808_09970, partial [Actinobacteria bacterium]|nr:hypothetical protein [Actinomycetota bacterium]